MSIDNEILRIKNAKTAIRNAVIARGGALTEDQLIDDYAAAVTALPTETDVDLDFVTATANDILSGKVGADANGLPVNGNIQVVTAELTDNVVTVSKGYIAEAQTLIVVEMAEPSVSGNVVTIGKGYNKMQKTKTIAEAGETTVSGNVVTTPAGYVKSERKTTVGTAKAAQTYTPGTSWKNIPAGTYLAGDQYIAGDENLIPENIAEGVSIFNVQGTHKGGMSDLDLFDWMTILD